VEVKLPDTIEECHSLIRNLLAVIEKMQAEIDELKARLNENSQNSNRPPSSDGFNKPKPAFSKKKKKRGGQSGHSGKTLKMVSEPDAVINCEPSRCECGGEFVSQAELVERRQVFDLPEPRLEVIEYRRVKRQCQCGQKLSGKFPERVSAPVQYGVKVQAMVALLSVQGCLAHRKIGQLFADLYGYELNEATTQALVTRTAEKIPIGQIKTGILASKVVKVDETGIRRDGILNWLHNVSTTELTYQFVHSKRGRPAMISEESIIDEYRGISVHDCWGSYFGFSEMKHAICNAHILRELKGIIENNKKIL
jgi:transposase